MNEFYTAKELAKLLKVSPWLIYERTKKGELPCVRLGRCIRYTQEAILTFANKA